LNKTLKLPSASVKPDNQPLFKEGEKDDSIQRLRKEPLRIKT
jgi:hypothetical protein